MESPPSVEENSDSPSPTEIEAVKANEEAVSAAKVWSAVLIVGTAVLFGFGIWMALGASKAAEYFAGYLLEQSLSVDNLFVFVLVFDYFKTPRKAQDAVLTFGIASAAILRLLLITAGTKIVGVFKPVLILFAAILLLSSYKLFTKDDAADEDGENSLGTAKLVRFFSSRMTLSSQYDGNNFFTVENGVKLATPLLLVLIVVELTDVVFAVDSIPAVFGVTLDPFIVYTSNIFAVLSLRSLYAFVAITLAKLKYIDKAIAAVLGFVGFKILADFAGFTISTAASLVMVLALLAAGVVASLVFEDGLKEDL